MLDTMFLELEQADDAAHMHIGAALIFDPLPGGGTPDTEEFLDHMRGRAEMVPRFAQQLSGPHAGPLRWLTWEQADGFDPEAHIHRATLPAPGGDAELYEWLGDFWSHRLDRHRPLWEMTLLDGLGGGRWALATKTHHCLVDGMGSVDIGNVLLDPSPVPAAARPRPCLTPRRSRRTARAGSGSPPASWRAGREPASAPRLHPARILRSRAGGAGADRARGGDRGA